MGEVPVHGAHLRAVEARDDLLGLLLGAPGREHAHLVHEALGPGLGRTRLARLRREHGLEAAGAVEREQLVERKGLRAAREAAHQHHELHRPSTASAAATIASVRCSQLRLWSRNGLGARRRSAAARYQCRACGGAP